MLLAVCEASSAGLILITSITRVIMLTAGFSTSLRFGRNDEVWEMLSVC